MANLRIVATNVADTATITATTANASYPASNLQTTLRGDLFRTSSVAADRLISLTWSANQSANCLALCRHNLTDPATWRVQFYSDPAWTTQIGDSGTVDAFTASLLGTHATIGSTNARGLKNSVYYHGSTLTTIRSVKITLNDTGNTDGFLEASRLSIGVYQEPTKNADFGATWSVESATKQARTDAGSLRSVTPRPPHRRGQLAMNEIEEADRKIWYDLYLYCDLSRDFWYSFYPGASSAQEVAVQGMFKFVSMGGISHKYPSHWSTEYTIEEA